MKMKTWHVDILILRGQRAHMAISHAVSKYKRHKRDTRCSKYNLWESKQLEIQRKLTKPNSTADLKRLNNPKINSKSGEEATIH